MEQLKLEKLQEQLLAQLDSEVEAGHTVHQIVTYKKLKEVMLELSSIYKQQIENLKKQIK